MNASSNWWGSNTAAGVAAKVSANVDYTPWLHVGTDTLVGTAGFQGSFAILNVDDNSPQVGATGRITEAIGLLPAAGGTINIQSGTYTENVDTSIAATTKAITLAPGGSPGLVTLNGNLTMDGNDVFSVDIAGYPAGTGYDQLVVNGTVTLGNATLNVNDSLSNPVALGSIFKIIDNNLADPVTGVFTIPYPAPAGGSSGATRFVVNGHEYAIYYDFGTAPGNGNDVALVLAPTFQDDFNRPNSSNLGPNWTTQTGAFSISGNMAASSTTVVSIATVNNPSFTDAIIQADVILNGVGSRAGLVARYSGPGENNFYLGMITNNAGIYEAYIFVKDPGEGTNGYRQLAFRNLPGFTGTGTLRFEVVGNQMKLFVNNVLQLVAYDSTITTPGLVGIRGLNNEFDNFSSVIVTTQTATLPFADTFTGANGSDLSRVWTERAGAFTIQGNAAVATDAVPGVSIATLNSAPVADSIVQGDVVVSNTTGALRRTDRPLPRPG